jgi:hypothetical protein
VLCRSKAPIRSDLLEADRLKGGGLRPGTWDLNFHGAIATDAALAEIATIPRLRWLHCQDPVSGDEGFIALGRCTTLECVASRVCRRMTGRGFAAIGRLPRLRSLSMGGPRVADAAMAIWRMRRRSWTSAPSCSATPRSSTSRRFPGSSG